MRPPADAGAVAGPRRLRLRLTLLYAVPFFVSGAALLGLPLLQVGNTVRSGPAPGPGEGTGQPPSAPGSRPGDALAGQNVHPGIDAGTWLTVSGIALVVMLVLALVLGWLVAGRFLRPLRLMTSTAREISATNLDRRLELGRPEDEFGELAQTLNDLFGRLQASFESQRRFVANASHELRTPLTAERALLQVALSDPDADVPTLRAACEDVLAVSRQQERLIEALLTLAIGEQAVQQREPFDLAGVAGSVLAGRRAQAQRRGITVLADLPSARVVADRHLTEILVANLVDNAVRHNVDGGRVEVRTSAPGSGGAGAGLQVRNSGPVVPPDQLDRLFQPFQRLGPQRVSGADGYGLGLAIVRAIADAHAATLTARALPGGGLQVGVRFAAAGDGEQSVGSGQVEGRFAAVDDGE